MRTVFNKEARLDFAYSGVITRDEPFLYQSKPNPFYTSFFYGVGSNVRWACLSLRAGEKWEKLSIQLKALQNGEITIAFRGPEAYNDYGRLYPVLVDWRSLKINRKVISGESQTVFLKKPFCKRVSVKKDEILCVEGEFRRHRFKIHDFTGLISENLWYFITGNLLIFFLIYRLLGFFAKHRERLRTSDTLLLVIFFPCLFFPMINISDEVKSARENRMLAEKPKIEGILKGDINTEGYEKWFDDHFCGRDALIKLHDVVRNQVSYIIRTHCSEVSGQQHQPPWSQLRRAHLHLQSPQPLNEGIYFKENNWGFLTPLVPDLDRKPAFSQSIVRNLVQLNQFCQQHKIKLYVFEVPKKEVIYKEFLRKRYGFDEKEFIKISQIQETIRSEVKKHHIPYIYLYEPLRDATKQDFVFFKCSHHWTDWGAFIGYCELMKEIRKDFPDMPLVSIRDYRKSQNWLYRDDYLENYRLPWILYQTFNAKDMNDRTPYNYYDHKNGAKMTVKVERFMKDFAYPEGKHTLMLIGTSQNEDLLHFLPYSAAQTKYIRLNKGQVKYADEFKIIKLYKKDILAFKPEILVLSFHTDNLSAIVNLCSPQ